MTNSEIINLWWALETISKDTSFTFDIITCFLLAKNKQIIAPIVNSIVEARKSLFQKYGKPNNKDITIPFENIEEFQTEFEKLMNIKVDLAIDKIPIEKFQGAKINIKLMEALLPIIEYKK